MQTINNGDSGKWWGPNLAVIPLCQWVLFAASLMWDLDEPLKADVETVAAAERRQGDKDESGYAQKHRELKRMPGYQRTIPCILHVSKKNTEKWKVAIKFDEHLS